MDGKIPRTRYRRIGKIIITTALNNTCYIVWPTFTKWSQNKLTLTGVACFRFFTNTLLNRDGLFCRRRRCYANVMLEKAVLDANSGFVRR